MKPDGEATARPSSPAFPKNRWHVAGFSWELQGQPVARILLGHPVVLFRTADGVAALEDRCCHRHLPLSLGTVEDRGLRCGYHGLLYDARGTCIEIPGQATVPPRARVRSHPLREQDQILWIWLGDDEAATPPGPPPAYGVHGDDRYRFRGGVVHYDAPSQLVHDNLLDLSHLAYVHLKTIGGDPGLHMHAPIKVEQSGDTLRIVRLMPDSDPPPTYGLAWPFAGKVDRWQEIEFHGSHLLIWAGAMDAGSGALDDPDRGGLHIRGFHGVTPETETTCHYFWTVATNPHPGMPDMTDAIREQVELTFNEDKAVIEAQHRNMRRFAGAPTVDIRVDVGPNRARRLQAEAAAGTVNAHQG